MDVQRVQQRQVAQHERLRGTQAPAQLGDLELEAVVGQPARHLLPTLLVEVNKEVGGEELDQLQQLADVVLDVVDLLECFHRRSEFVHEGQVRIERLILRQAHQHQQVVETAEVLDRRPEGRDHRIVVRQQVQDLRIEAERGRRQHAEHRQHRRDHEHGPMAAPGEGGRPGQDALDHGRSPPQPERSTIGGLRPATDACRAGAFPLIARAARRRRPSGPYGRCARSTRRRSRASRPGPPTVRPAPAGPGRPTGPR